MTDQWQFLRTQMRCQTTQWNMGSFGAIAEFMRDPDEAAEIVDEPHCLSVVTRRGALALHPVDALRLYASETPTAESWSHRVALCLPIAAAAMARRTVLTELGTDSGALTAAHREAILFDMGLGTAQCDVCIRTDDPHLISHLRAHANRSLFDAGNAVMGAIIAAGPHRVFLTRLGRCEVYQRIPPADGKSPEGPHTHVLPKLLRLNRTHAATEPVPPGYVPCAHLVPAHPARDAMGHRKAWDAAEHMAFQSILAAYGDKDVMAFKTRLTDILPDDADEPTITGRKSKLLRQAYKVWLRQFQLASVG